MKGKTEKEKVEWDNGGKMHGQRTGGVRVRGRCVEVVGLGHPPSVARAPRTHNEEGSFRPRVLRESGKRGETERRVVLGVVDAWP